MAQLLHGEEYEIHLKPYFGVEYKYSRSYVSIAVPFGIICWATWQEMG